MANRDLVTMGGGVLELQAIQTGFLKGPVTLNYERSGLRFPPSDVSLQTYDGVFTFRVDEDLVLKAAQAELSQSAMRLALGLDSTDISTITGSPSYDPASFVPATAGTSYDAIRLGHNVVTETQYQTLLFTHTVPQTSKTATLILYRVYCRSKFSLVFDKRDIVIAECEWIAVPDNTRPDGDRVGMILNQE